MISPSIDITWSLAEAEAAHAGFSEIGLAHLWVGVCKAVEVSVSELLKAANPELQAMEEQVEADFQEVREAFSAVGLSPKVLRRAIRAELGRRSGKFARPFHRSPALRVVFEQGSTLVPVNGGRLQPAHLLVALIEQWDPAVSSAVTKLRHDSFEILRGLWARLIEGFDVDAAEGEQDREAEEKKDRKAKKDPALRRFGRDLTELAAKGALPPLIGRRKEMLKITQIQLQSRKNNLILVGEPGVGKTGIVEGFAQLLAEGRAFIKPLLAGDCGALLSRLGVEAQPPTGFYRPDFFVPRVEGRNFSAEIIELRGPKPGAMPVYDAHLAEKADFYGRADSATWHYQEYPGWEYDHHLLQPGYVACPLVPTGWWGITLAAHNWVVTCAQRRDSGHRPETEQFLPMNPIPDSSPLQI